MQPETTAVVPKKTLRDLLDDFVTLRDTLEGMEEDAPDRAYLEALYANIESKYPEKADRFAAFMRELDRIDKGYGEEIQRFTRRRKAVQALIERRREYARDSMASNGITQIKGKAYTISLSDGKKRVEIDPALVTDKYWRETDMMPNVIAEMERWYDEARNWAGARNANIRARPLIDHMCEWQRDRAIDDHRVESDLKRGIEVPGARLVDGTQFITIR